MAEFESDFPTVIGADAKFKGEISFERGVRVEGIFEGEIKSKGSLHVAEGAKLIANVEATNIKVEGECKGNLHVTEKLQLLATARVDGDIRTNRLEISDGAIFIGNVVVGQSSKEPSVSRPSSFAAVSTPQPMPQASGPREPQPLPTGMPRPRQHDARVPANP